jgi:hypothetical protein
MDIEGAEYEILKNEADALLNCSCMIVELHGDDKVQADFCNRMLELSFTLKERKHSVWVFARNETAA